MSNVIVAPHVRDLDALAAQIAGWAQGRIAGASDVTVENLSYPKGAGQSHETILFDLAWSEGGARRTQGCALRIKPTGFTMFPDDLYEQQVKLLQVLHAQGNVRVAEVLWVETDPSLFGAPFFVMEKIHGRVAVSVPPYVQTGWVAEATTAQRERMWESGVRQLAAIQKTPLEAVPFLAGSAKAARGLEQEWDKYQRFVAWISEDRRWPVLEAALDRLERAWPRNQPSGVVWGDARIGNMMFGDDFEVRAVVDWEQPSLGGALHDLAWWLVNARMMHSDADGRPKLSGFGTREETIALWREATGVSTDDLEWYEDFTDLKFSCLSIRMAGLRGSPLPSEDWLAQRLKIRLPA